MDPIGPPSKGHVGVRAIYSETTVFYLVLPDMFTSLLDLAPQPRPKHFRPRSLAEFEWLNC